MPATPTRPKRRYKKCSSCEEPLDEEESLNPRRDGRFVICDECYHDRFEFICCKCENYEHVDHQHKMVVVFRAEAAFTARDQSDGFTAGVYHIKGFPYYSGNYFDMWLNANRLERIANLWCTEEEAMGNWYPCGHLCLQCQKVLLTFLSGDNQC